MFVGSVFLQRSQHELSVVGAERMFYNGKLPLCNPLINLFYVYCNEGGQIFFDSSQIWRFHPQIEKYGPIFRFIFLGDLASFGFLEAPIMKEMKNVLLNPF